MFKNYNLFKNHNRFKNYFVILAFISAPALAKETLTVYTTSSFASEWGPGPVIKRAFEVQCGCELKLLAVSDGVAVLNRLQLEGKKTKADLVLGLDNNLIAAAEKTGLFVPHAINIANLTLPNGWHNSYFVPYDYGYFAFIYNQEKISDPPTSLDQLINSPKPWRVIYQDPRTSTPGFGLMLWLQKVYGDKSAKEWQKLAKKTVTVTKGWSEGYGLFLKGEADFVLSYTTSPAYHMIAKNDRRYIAAQFSEGHYLQIEVMGVLASSPHQLLAQQFMQFMLRPAAQQALLMNNWMYPVIAMPLPEAFGPATRPAITLEFTPAEVAAQRSRWLRTWQDSTSR